ncbi:MAG: DsbA family protein [Chthoniobacterales bacterium]
MPAIRVTYYLEVLSSWCHWAEPTWTALQARYAAVAEFDWKIALMEASAFPESLEQCDWFYRRSGTIRRSPYKLNPGWFETGQGQFLPPSLMALAAKQMGVADDSVRMALAHAALIEGQKVADWQIAAEVASRATGIFPQELLEKARSPEILQAAQVSTEEFRQLQVTQRPAFLIESPIGDRAVFSGLVHFTPLAATIDAMLEDAAGYASYEAHFGKTGAVSECDSH